MEKRERENEVREKEHTMLPVRKDFLGYRENKFQAFVP